MVAELSMQESALRLGKLPKPERKLGILRPE